MPDAYEAMRNKFVKQGLTLKAAKTKAARIYNSNARKRGLKPVTGRHHKRSTKSKKH